MAMTELSDAKLQVNGVTYIRNWGPPAQEGDAPGYHLELRVDQIAIVTEHVRLASSAAGDRRPDPAFAALNGQATMTGGCGLVLLGSDQQPSTNLKVQIKPYDEPDVNANSLWVERTRTSWPASVFLMGQEWHLGVHVPRPVFEALARSVAGELLAELSLALKIDAWVKEKVQWLDGQTLYLQPTERNPNQAVPTLGYLTVLRSQERLLVLGRSEENVTAERSAIINLLSEVRTVRVGVWAVFVLTLMALVIK